MSCDSCNIDLAVSLPSLRYACILSGDFIWSINVF